MLAMKKTALIWALLGATACGDDKKDDADANGNGNGNDAGKIECGLDSRSSSASAATGIIKGKVTLGAMTMPGGNYAAKGDLALAVLPAFEPTKGCPGDPGAPKPVANTLIRCADFTGGKTVEYEIRGVPPRAEPYVIIPFLDVNGNGIDDESSAGPDTCDLLGSVSPLPEATVAAAGDVVELDLELSTNAAILGVICGLPDCK